MTPAQDLASLMAAVTNAEEGVQLAINAHLKGYPDHAWQHLAGLVVTLGNLHSDLRNLYDLRRTYVYCLEGRESSPEKPWSGVAEP